MDARLAAWQENQRKKAKATVAPGPEAAKFYESLTAHEAWDVYLAQLRGLEESSRRQMLIAIEQEMWSSNPEPQRTWLRLTAHWSKGQMEAYRNARELLLSLVKGATDATGYGPDGNGREQAGDAGDVPDSHEGSQHPPADG